MTESKYKPILFSAPMVRAILESRKTQTRRIVKFNAAGRVQKSGKQWHIDDKDAVLACPYGQPGDRLWVRETWQHSNFPFGPLDKSCAIFYREDYLNDPLGPDLELDTSSDIRRKWNPSIHMPRWASRITIEITSVHVERLQDISEDDAIAEGLKCITKDGGLYKYGLPDADGLPGKDDFGWPWVEWHASPVIAYKKLWEKIHGPGAWEKNPWVWVVEFKRVEE